MSERITVLAAAVLVAVLGCSQHPADPSRKDVRADVPQGAGSEIREIAETYRNLRAMTPEPVHVNPEFAELCVPVVPRELVEEARKEHGVHANRAIMIYMNDLAAEAFGSDAPAYPEGAVIVKEKQRLEYWNAEGAWESELNGVGGMIKRGPDFDPEHGNWEYFYYERPERIESGRIASCVACHDGAKATDYVFGSWRDAE